MNDFDLCSVLVEHFLMPTCNAGAPFPANFPDVVKTILKRLFRVYAHIYHSHFQVVVKLKEEAHLNTCFKHFTLFTLVRKNFVVLERNFNKEILGEKNEVSNALCSRRLMRIFKNF